MHWLEACANETMRLKPVAPSLTLQALRDTTVADIRVPGGTLVFLAMRSDSLREAYFARAAAFDPQRWLDPESGPGATSANRVSMPFGAGPRVCPGRHLAMLEMKMALATLIGRFEIEQRRHARRQRAGRADVVRDGAERPDDAAAAAPSAPARRLAQRRQRLLAVGDQVLDRLEADREAHQRAAVRPACVRIAARSYGTARLTGPAHE